MFATCCDWMKNTLQRAGEQGIAVIASRVEGGRQFYLQARPLTPGQEQNWQRLVSKEPGRTQLEPLFRDERGRLAAVLVSLRVPLRFCPLCGSDLGKLIDRQREAFDAMAESHRPFDDAV